MEETYVIVPVKPFRRAKSRLSPVLSRQVRAALARALLARTLGVVAACKRPLKPVVVSRDITALDLARQRGATAILESESGLNPALDQARAWAVAHGAQALLILPADLPLLSVDDLAVLLDTAGRGPGVVIAPDERGEGTNALLVRPPEILSFAYGPQSFGEHCAQAETWQVPLHVVRLPGLALDLDTPGDWRGLADQGVSIAKITRKETSDA